MLSPEGLRGAADTLFNEWRTSVDDFISDGMMNIGNSKSAEQATKYGIVNQKNLAM